jgi:hypothetical protein
MKTRLLNTLLIFALATFAVACQGLENSNSSGEPQSSDLSEDPADDSQSEGASETSAPTTSSDDEDSETATEDSQGDNSGDDTDSEDNSCDHEGSEDDDDDWGGEGPAEECFQGCEASLEQMLEECDPEGNWELFPEEVPPPQEEPEDSDGGDEEPEPESEEEPGEGDWEPNEETEACLDEAFAAFDACLSQCDPEAECAGSGGPGEDEIDCPDYSSPNCAEDQYVEWFEDETGCEHPECVDYDDDNGDDDGDVIGIFECGESACVMWQEYCQTTYPGQPQGQIQRQCLPLPGDCNEETGYCSCIESVVAGAGMCEEQEGIVYVTIYAP